MTIVKYIIKSLWFFRKQHLAVFLGTVVSTAVLTGALIIGDSVKYSLHELVNLRLGNVEYAMSAGDRYVSSGLADKMCMDLDANLAAVLHVKGVAIQPENQLRINNIQVYGIDDKFQKFTADNKNYRLKAGEAILSANLVEKLGLKPGDEFLLRIEKGSLIPANAPFVSDESQTLALRVTLTAIANEKQLGRFSLKNNQVSPYNAFVSRDYLASEMELKGQANLLLASSKNNTSPLSQSDLQKSLEKNWELNDISLKIRNIQGKDQLELISDRVFIDTPIADAIQNLELQKQSLLTYFVNKISHYNRATPYSFVSSVGTDARFENLSDTEIILNNWLANDINSSVGDTIHIDYFVIGPLRSLKEEKQSFVVREILPLQSNFFDSSMMPSFPGLSNAGSCNDWEAGIPVDFSKIRKKDEDYWKNYKGTPKAFISQDKAIELWSNKYGKYTAFRFETTGITQDALSHEILSVIHPELLNLNFLPVRQQGAESADNMVDFSSLFISLSFFIILAAILLTVLIYSLNLDNRTQETGILLGLGWNRNTIVQIRIYESLCTVFLGGIIGVVMGILYNQLLLQALNSIWQDVVRTNMLSVHLKPGTLFLGFLTGIATAMLCIWIVTRKKLRKTANRLIQNTTEDKYKVRTHGISMQIAILSLLSTLGLVLYALFSSPEQNATVLLSAGALFMAGACLLMHLYLQKLSVQKTTKTPGLLRLAMKNAARNRKRSMASIVLLALGTFSVLITGANRKSFFNAENSVQSGTGGYKYWLETTMPILSDLSTREGQEKLGFAEGDIDETVQLVQFRTLDGDDASCLNLNQVQKPRILGFDPQQFEKRSAFSFASLHKSVDAKHPWKALNQNFGENVIPAYADQTVLVWGLKKNIGDTLVYRDEFGKEMNLLLIGGLNNSVFQGNLLIADESFQKHFPSNSGSKLILIDFQLNKEDQLMLKFQENLQDLGVNTMKTSERLAAFYSVENTYLSMFMFLGGLGVIIGTIGFGVILMRNIWERKKELALLKAIGFTPNSLFRLLFYENLFLLLSGLLCGTGAAFIGILPSLLSPAFNMPIVYVVSLLAAILGSGLIWIWIPAAWIRKYRIIESLKNE